MNLPQLWHLKHTMSLKNADYKGIKLMALEYPKPKVWGKMKTFGRIYDKAVSILTSGETK